jgi:hypothetical protein
LRPVADSSDGNEVVSATLGLAAGRPPVASRSLSSRGAAQSPACNCEDRSPLPRAAARPPPTGACRRRAAARHPPSRARRSRDWVTSSVIDCCSSSGVACGRVRVRLRAARRGV